MSARNGDNYVSLSRLGHLRPGCYRLVVTALPAQAHLGSTHTDFTRA